MSDVTPSDHDILIEVRTMQGIMFDELKEIKEGTSSKINDHEKRLKSVEEYKGVIKTTLALYGVAIGAGFTVILYLLFKNT